MKKIVKWLTLVVSIFLITACGGSGGDNDQNPLNPSSDYPVFTSNDKVDFPENSTKSVITLTAKDQNKVYFYPAGGKDIKYFIINTTTGVVDFRTPPDYEFQQSYEIIITADDHYQNETNQTLTINIIDLDEESVDITAPKFDTSNLLVKVDENQIDVKKIIASDVGRLNYYISGGTDASSFSIDGSSDILQFKTAPDYETKNLYYLEVTAEDSSGNKSVQYITVKLNDIDESVKDTTDPDFNISKITVYENETYVTRIQATDINRITYSIGGIDANSFGINSEDGTLRFKTAPDYEIKQTYYLDITATDSEGNSKTERNVKVSILDVVETVADITAPIFTSLSSASVLENQTTAITLRATDSNSITYSISGTDAGYFTVNSSTGVVTFRNAADYESKNSYAFTAKAIDSKGNSQTKNVTITILDVNEISESDYFITTWKTDNEGISNSKQITIPTIGNGYNYSVDWGDGTSNKNITGNIVHTYSNSGIYTVKISGSFPRFYMNDTHSISAITSDSLKLLSIEQWGKIKWESMNSAFCGCKNMQVNTADIPDLSKVSDMSKMFYYVELFNHPVNSWDVSNVTDMNSMFMFAKSFNQPLNSWDVSNVTDMNHLFWLALEFNQPLNSWDVSNVTDMNSMFWFAQKFNQDLSLWNVSKVRNMSQMFGKSLFNQPLNSWDVSNVTDMNYMFAGSIFNQPLNFWDVSNVINMNSMFQGTSNFNQNISNWDVSNVTNMQGVFWNAKKFNQNISNWDVSSVTTMELMFYGANNFNHDISSWNVYNVSNMRWMFKNALSFSNHDLSTWNVENVTNHIDFSNGWGTGNTEPNWND